MKQGLAVFIGTFFLSMVVAFLVTICLIDNDKILTLQHQVANMSNTINTGQHDMHLGDAGAGTRQ